MSAHAEILSIGLLGGAPFTDVVNSVNQNNISFVSRSSNFTIGPAVRLSLPFNFRVEVDALYRPYEFTAANSLAPSTIIENVSAQQWRFPVLAQYRFGTPVIKPFVEGGVSFDHLSGISAAVKSAIASGPGQFVQQTHAGVVLGAGVDVKVPFVRLSGELRYTHQGSADFNAISKVNQAEVLFGVHF